jgi:hypothetical protein
MRRRDEAFAGEIGAVREQESFRRHRATGAAQATSRPKQKDPGSGGACGYGGELRS